MQVCRSSKPSICCVKWLPAFIVGALVWACCAPVSAQTTAQAAYRQGVEKYNKRDVEGAVAAFSRAIQIDPRFADAYHGRGVAHSVAGRHRDALKDLDRALAINPRLTDALVNRAKAKIALNNFAGAIADANRAISITPNSSLAFTYRAWARASSRDRQGGLADATRAIELDSKNARAYNIRGVIRHMSGQYAAAKADYDMAIENDGSDATGYTNRGLLKFDMNDMRGALADFNRSVELQPDEAAAYVNRARTSYNLGDWAASLSDFRKAISLSDASSNTSYHRFYIWLIRARLGEQQAASTELRRYFARLKKRSGQSWERQIAEYLLGDLPEARFLAEARDADAGRSREKTTEAYFYAGSKRLISGNLVLAKRYLDISTSQRVPHFIEHKSALAELATLSKRSGATRIATAVPTPTRSPAPTPTAIRVPVTPTPAPTRGPGQLRPVVEPTPRPSPSPRPPSATLVTPRARPTSTPVPTASRVAPPPPALPTALPTATPARAGLDRVESPEVKEFQRIRTQAQNLLTSANYTGLEETARQYRTSRAMFSTGIWKLTVFYDGVSSLPGNEARNARTIQRLRAWAKAKPLSSTAAIALAEALVNLAWNEQGRNDIGALTPGGGQRAQTLLQESRLILRRAKSLRVKCPHWWAVTQQVGLGQAWDRRTYDGLFTEAISAEPDYTTFYIQKLVYLLPGWQGDQGEWQAFARSAGQARGGEAGDILYARLIWYVMRQRNLNESFREPEVSWARLDRGFSALLKRYPGHLTILSAWAKLSRLSAVGDAAPQKLRARELFQRIGDRFDAGVWRDEREFQTYRRWSLGG